MPPKRVRKANFRAKEVDVLLEEVRLKKEVIKSQFTTDITNKKKNEVWDAIAVKLTCCGVEQRTLSQLMY